MPTLTFRNYRTSEKVDLEFDNVERLSVEEVRKKVSTSMKLPLEELSESKDGDTVEQISMRK